MEERIIALIPVSGADPEFAEGRMPDLQGMPLIQYTLRAAREATLIDRVIVSTDSQQIAEACHNYGAEEPILRPLNLANPVAPITEVLRHSLKWLEESESYVPEWVVMLLITYPFRPRGFVDTFIRTVQSQDLDSAFVAIEERQAHWIVGEGRQPELVTFGSETPRAKKVPLYRDMAGYISMAKREIILSGKLYGQKLGIIPSQEMWVSINVHEESGRQMAELLAPEFLRSN